MAKKKGLLRRTKNAGQNLADIEELAKKRRLDGASRQSLSPQELQQVHNTQATAAVLRQVVHAYKKGWPGRAIAESINLNQTQLSRKVTKPLKKQRNPPVTGPSDTQTWASRYSDTFDQHLDKAIFHLRAALLPDYCSLVIGAWPSVLQSFIPLVFEALGMASGRFQEEFPNAKVQCIVVDNEEIPSLLDKGSIDFALGHYVGSSRANSGLVHQPLLSCEEFGLLLPRNTSAMPTHVQVVLKELARSREDPKRTDSPGPIPLELLKRLTFFDAGNTFSAVLDSEGEDSASLLPMRVSLYANMEVLRCVQRGLGVGLGHRPTTPEFKSAVHFVPLAGVSLSGVSDATAKRIWEFAKSPYPVDFIHYPARRKLNQSEIQRHLEEAFQLEAENCAQKYRHRVTL